MLVVLSLGIYITIVIGNATFSLPRVLLDPTLMILGLFAISCFITYPIEVIRPRALKGRWIFYLSIPTLLSALPLLFGMQFQALHSWSDLMEHFWDFDVLLRIFDLLMVLVVSLLLLFIPLNWKQSSADNAWIRNTTLVAQGITIFFYAHAITNLSIFYYLHVLWMTFSVLYFTYYELEVRILPPATEPSTQGKGQVRTPEKGVRSLHSPAVETPAPAASGLWQRICNEIDGKEIWRNPNASVEMISTAVGSNRIYVADSIREHSGLTVNDYLNRKRTDYMVSQLRKDPEQDQKPLYFEVGYRSRQTAYRNFVKFVGCSPSDFVESL